MQIQKTRSYFSQSHKAAVQVQCCILHMPAHFQEVVSLDLHGYADDHGLKTSFTPVPEYEAIAIADTERCLTDIKTWIDQN